MFEATVLVLAIHAGVDIRVVGLVGFALWMPFPALAALAIHAYRQRPAIDTRSAVFCQTVARALRAGGDLRDALLGAGEGVSAPRLVAAMKAGATMSEIGPTLDAEFPDIGEELATLVASVAMSGASSQGLFDELGDLSMARIEMTEEVRVATAPARASALVLIGLPIVYIGFQFASGRIRELISRPIQQGLTLVGLALVFLGIGVSVWIVRRAT